MSIHYRTQDVDGFKIFYLDGASLWTTNDDGANPYRLDGAVNAYELAVDDTYVYWVTAGTLYRASKIGYGTQAFPLWQGGGTTFITVGPRYVFVGDGSNLRRIDKQTLAMVTTAMTAGPANEPLGLTSVAADGDAVWFGGYTGPNAPFFGRLAVDGTITWVDNADPSKIVVHGDSVYYHAIANGRPSVKRVCR